MRLSQKLQIGFTHDPANPLLDTHPKKMKPYVKMFALHIHCSIFTRNKYPSMDGRVRQWLCIQRTPFSSKKEGNLRMSLRNILLSEIIQAQRTNNRCFHLKEESKNLISEARIEWLLSLPGSTVRSGRAWGDVRKRIQNFSEAK